MKVAVAIDSFKGSMTSMQAGNACKEGILAAARAHCDGGAAAVRDRKPAADNMDVVVKPLADGGEGTVEALVEGMNGIYEYVTVTDPMGSHVKARYGILPDQTAGDGGGIRHYTCKRTVKSMESSIHRSRRNDSGCSSKRMPQIYHWNWRQCDDRGRHRNVIGTGL